METDNNIKCEKCLKRFDRGYLEQHKTYCVPVKARNKIVKIKNNKSKNIKNLYKKLRKQSLQIQKLKNQNNNLKIKTFTKEELLLKSIYKDPRWYPLKEQVLKNYNNSCSLCNSKHKVKVYHIWTPDLNPELSFELSNLTAKCKACRTKITKDFKVSDLANFIKEALDKV